MLIVSASLETPRVCVRVCVGSGHLLGLRGVTSHSPPGLQEPVGALSHTRCQDAASSGRSLDPLHLDAPSRLFPACL